MSRAPGWAAAALVVGGVVAVDPAGFAPFTTLRFAVVSTLVAAGAVAVVRSGSLPWHRWLVAGWVGFLAWVAITAVAGVDPLSAWLGTPDRHLGWLTWLLFGIAFFVGMASADRDDVELLARAAAVAVLILGVYAVAEWWGVAPTDFPGDRVGGPYGTPAYLGAAPALLVPIVFGASVDGTGSTLWRRAGIVAVALGLVAAVLTQTRAGWVGLAVAGVVVVPATCGTWLRRHRAVLVAGAVALVAVALLTPVGSRLADAVDLADGGGRARLDEWRVGAAVLAAHPIVAVGPEGYRIAFAEGVDADYERRYGRVVMPDRAHNGLLDIGVTTGIPGLAATLAMIGFLVTRVLRAVRGGNPLVVGIAAGVLGYLAQLQFLFPIAEVDPVFWVFAGALVAATTRLERVALPSWAWVAPLVLAAALGTAGALDVVADHRAAAALASARQGDRAGAVAAAEQAAALRPDSFRYRLVAATVAAEPPTAPHLEEAIGHLDAALRLSPGDPILRSTLAARLLDLAQLTGDRAVLATAVDHWEALVAHDPHHAEYRLQLGLAYVLAGDPDAAETQWRAAADLAPASGAPLVNLAILALDQGRTADAAELVAAIRELDPDLPQLAELERRLASAG